MHGEENVSYCVTAERRWYETELIRIPTIIRHVFKLYSYNRRVHLTALGAVRRFYELKIIMGKEGKTIMVFKLLFDH